MILLFIFAASFIYQSSIQSKSVEFHNSTGDVLVLWQPHQIGYASDQLGNIIEHYGTRYTLMTWQGALNLNGELPLFVNNNGSWEKITDLSLNKFKWIGADCLHNGEKIFITFSGYNKDPLKPTFLKTIIKAKSIIR